MAFTLTIFACVLAIAFLVWECRNHVRVERIPVLAKERIKNRIKKRRL